MSSLSCYYYTTNGNTTGISWGNHLPADLPQNRPRFRRWIRSLRDGPADHDVAGSRRDGFGRSHDAHLISHAGPGRAHPRGYDREFVPKFRAQSRSFASRGHHALASIGQCDRRQPHHAVFHRAANPDLFQVASVALVACRRCPGAEVTTPWHPLASAIVASRTTLSSTVPPTPIFSRSFPSMLVSTVTASTISSGRVFAASTAARSILPLPDAWTVSMLTPSFAASLTAAPTVFGMSWYFRSRNTRRPEATRSRTTCGPSAV